MIEFLFGYWIGKDSQKDPKGTMLALFIAPFLLIFCFWAYYAFIDFSKIVWTMYLTYSAWTTINLDFIIIGALMAINFLVDRMIVSKALNRQLLG